MSFLVPKTPNTAAQDAATKPTPPVDAADTANRQALARTRRLSGAGADSTILGSAMSARAGATNPRAALTGIGG